MVCDSKARLAQKRIDSKVYNALTRVASRKQRKVVVAKQGRLHELRPRHGYMTLEILNFSIDGCKITGCMQAAHGFDGKHALRENHYRLATHISHSLVRIHSLTGGYGQPR